MNWFGRNTKIVGGVALALAIAIITHFEGTKQTSYLDPVGIVTICTGHTGPDVTLHQQASPQACQGMLEKDIQDTWDSISVCIQVPLNPYQQASVISFAFNIGASRFCHSTMAALLNKKEYTAACNELPKWIYGGGRVLPGLVARRKAEQQLCLHS